MKNLITYYLINFTWIGFDSIHSQGETAEFDSVNKLILNKNYFQAINFLKRLLLDNPGNYETANLFSNKYDEQNSMIENHFLLNRNHMIK